MQEKDPFLEVFLIRDVEATVFVVFEDECETLGVGIVLGLFSLEGIGEFSGEYFFESFQGVVAVGGGFGFFIESIEEFGFV